MAANQSRPADGFERLRLVGRPERHCSHRYYYFDNGATLEIVSRPAQSCTIYRGRSNWIGWPCDRATAARALAWGRHNRKGAGNV